MNTPPPDCAVPVNRPLRVRSGEGAEGELLAIGWDRSADQMPGQLPRDGFVYLVLDRHTGRPAWTADADVDGIREVAP